MYRHSDFFLFVTNSLKYFTGYFGIAVQWCLIYMSTGFSSNYSVFSWLVDFHKKNNADAFLLIPDELMKRGPSTR
jgi:hypothetical protein